MILIVGPNTGAFLGGGGGSRVALNMAEILAEAGYEIGLVAAGGLPVEELDALHGTNLRQYVDKGSIKLRYFLGRNYLHMPFPFKVRFLSVYLTQKLAGGEIDLVVFHDDVPKPPISRKWPVRSILYSHFPYMARIFFNVCDPSEVNNSMNMLKERIIRILMGTTIYMKDRPEGLLIANSSVTKGFMERVWGSGIRTLFPPVNLPECQPDLVEKEDLVTVIGTIQPNKRLGEILAGFSLTKRGRLCIVGRTTHDWYFDWVVNKIKSLGVGERVQLLTDVEDIQKTEILQRSKIIVSASRFEPFGISVVEGMSAGCVPVVSLSELSGPWVDVCDRGKYGFGYKDTNELGYILDSILSNSDYELYSAKAKKRSQEFSYMHFKKQWMDLVQEAFL